MQRQEIRRGKQFLTFAFQLSICVLCSCISSSVRFATPEISRDLPAGLHGTPEFSRLRQATSTYLGIPYKYGGMTRDGIDCSGLVCCVFRDIGTTGFPHSAQKMMRLGKRVPLAQARPGDLLFFRKGFLGFVDHVAVYVGDGRFVHASTTLGVIESSVDDDYYRSRFSQARRLF